ncbi:hypothetical protein LY76DRAFT_41879 [Colletotrichum caudatum]|nr:hypothetical protein LY76DRAFT_41879 [Colletotrichum caudatum]
MGGMRLKGLGQALKPFSARQRKKARLWERTIWDTQKVSKHYPTATPSAVYYNPPPPSLLPRSPHRSSWSCLPWRLVGPPSGSRSRHRETSDLGAGRMGSGAVREGAPRRAPDKPSGAGWVAAVFATTPVSGLILCGGRPGRWDGRGPALVKGSAALCCLCVCVCESCDRVGCWSWDREAGVPRYGLGGDGPGWWGGGGDSQKKGLRHQAFREGTRIYQEGFSFQHLL